MDYKKFYTDIEQSRKLAKMLPLESADMRYAPFGDTHPWVWEEEVKFLEKDSVPCWSLVALLNVLPQGTRLLKSTNISTIGDIKYHCDCSKVNVDKWSDNPVDACYELILNLHELKML